MKQIQQASKSMAFSASKKQNRFLFIYQVIFCTVPIQEKKHRQKFYYSSFNERDFFFFFWKVFFI